MTVTGSRPDGFKLSVEPVRWMVFAEWEKQTVPVGSGQQSDKQKTKKDMNSRMKTSKNSCLIQQ